MQPSPAVASTLVAASAILGALLLRPAEGAPAHGEEPVPEPASAG